MIDSRIIRDRQQADGKTIDRTRDLAPVGTTATFAQTTTVSSYPTTASAFYACLPADLDGTESEGASATYVQESSTPFYAWNAGTQVPPVGTPIVCHAVGGRWVFRYDG